MESRTGRSDLTGPGLGAPRLGASGLGAPVPGASGLDASPALVAVAKTRALPESVPSARGIAERFRSLSRREAEVCSLVARRLSTAEIAACLFISPRTVEKHVEMIFDKLDTRSREQLRWRLGVFPNLDRDVI